MVQIPDVVANRLGLPTCDNCKRRFDHEDYTELGNLIASTTAISGAVLGIFYALVPYIWSSEVATRGSAKLLKKVGKDELAEEVMKYSTVEQAFDHLENYVDPKWEEVRWEEINGQLLCYKCK